MFSHLPGKEEPGGARKSQEEPGAARRCREISARRHSLLPSIRDTAASGRSGDFSHRGSKASPIHTQIVHQWVFSLTFCDFCRNPWTTLTFPSVIQRCLMLVRSWKWKKLLLASRWTSLYFPGQGLDNFETPFPFQNFQENTWIIEKPSFTDPGIPLQNK